MNNLNTFAQPDQLERNSFLWSEVRLIIAAIALFIGGSSPIIRYNPIPGLYGPISSLLTLAWLISGVAAAYLLYRWDKGDKKLFGKDEILDKVAFLISVISGINLGITGLIQRNIGMSVGWQIGMLFSRDYVNFILNIIFVIVGLLYLASAYHLYKRWNESGQRLF